MNDLELRNCCEIVSRILTNLDLGKPLRTEDYSEKEWAKLEKGIGVDKYFEYLYTPEQQTTITNFFGRMFIKQLCDNCHLKLGKRTKEQNFLQAEQERNKV